MLKKLLTLAVFFTIVMSVNAFARNKTGDTILWTKNFGSLNSVGELEVTLTKSTALHVEQANFRYLADYHTRARTTKVPIWTKTIGGPKSDKGYAVIKARGDGVITVEYKRTPAGGYEVHLSKTNKKGEILLDKTYIAAGRDKLAVTGWALSFSEGGIEVYTLRLGSAAVEENLEKIPETQNGPSIETFSLSQNYPNPFNPSTTITYSIQEAGPVSLKIYNLLGQQVATLLDKKQSAGAHTVIFDASYLASGYYVYRLQAGKSVETRKMMLLK
ncbi:MAG: T9SS type A sorting domain-containing protein [bacterium]